MTNYVKSREDFFKRLPREGIIAEVGVFKGENADKVYKINKPKQFYLIDCWGFIEEQEHGGSWEDTHKCNDGRYLKVKQRFATYPNIHVIKGYSTSVAKMFKNDSFDFVYIDGNHSYDWVKRDIQAWWPKVKKGGILAGHDYRNHRGFGVIQAVKELTKQYKVELTLLSKENHPDWAVTK